MGNERINEAIVNTLTNDLELRQAVEYSRHEVVGSIGML